MAHELTFRDGAAQMFTVREPAWHREGTLLEAAPSYEEALRLGELDYRVVKVPVQYERPTANEGVTVFTESELAYLTIRTDTGDELGHVGPDYQICQNRNAFGILEPLIDSGLARIETGGSLRNGADAWLLVRLQVDQLGEEARTFFAEEQLAPYALVAANHAGRRGILAALTPIRVVCANTLAFAEEHGLTRSIVVQHRGEVEARVVEAGMELFGDLMKRCELAAGQFKALRRTALSLNQFRELVECTVCPNPQEHPQWNPEGRMASAVVSRYERKRDRIRTLWTEGDGHRGDHSAWEAYNGVCQALDHDTELWPTRGGVYRTASLMGGALVRMKNQVLDDLVEHAEFVEGAY